MEYTNSLLECTLKTYINTGCFFYETSISDARTKVLLHDAWSTGFILFKLAFKMSLYYCNYQTKEDDVYLKIATMKEIINAYLFIEATEKI